MDCCRKETGGGCAIQRRKNMFVCMKSIVLRCIFCGFRRSLSQAAIFCKMTSWFHPSFEKRFRYGKDRLLNQLNPRTDEKLSGYFICYSVCPDRHTDGNIVQNPLSGQCCILYLLFLQYLAVCFAQCQFPGFGKCSSCMQVRIMVYFICHHVSQSQYRA